MKDGGRFSKGLSNMDVSDTISVDVISENDVLRFKAEWPILSCGVNFS
jgi:hypothetical protein